MKWLCILCFLGLSSCRLHDKELFAVYSLKDAKKIALLQKKLDVAEGELEKKEVEVMGLRTSILSMRLLVIEKRVDYFEEQIKKNSSRYCICPDFMGEEREQLLQVLEEYPGAAEAYQLLDRILNLIATRGNQ